MLDPSQVWTVAYEITNRLTPCVFVGQARAVLEEESDNLCLLLLGGGCSGSSSAGRLNGQM